MKQSKNGRGNRANESNGRHVKQGMEKQCLDMILKEE